MSRPARSADERAAAREARRKKLRRRRLTALGAVAGVAAVAVVGGWALIGSGGTSISVAEIEDGAVVGPSTLADGISVEAGDEDVTLTVDGERVAAGPNGRYPLERLSDGKHLVRAEAGSSSEEWTITVDTTAPTVDAGVVEIKRGSPAPVITGTVDEAATLSIPGAKVSVDGGEFELRPKRVKAGQPIVIAATDPAGNAAKTKAPVRRVPRRPDVPVKAVHVESWAWNNPDLRGPVMQMLEAGEITTIQIDLKNEAGVVGYDSKVPRARAIGAIQPGYELEKTVNEIHARGGRVVGRIVVFRDPILAGSAWAKGKRDQVLQTPAGEPYGAGYGGFTNYASQPVRDYNTAIIKEAARAGVDEIMLDYIRRPDKPTSEFTVPGMTGSHEDEIVEYVAQVEEALAPHGTYLGAAVFGVAAETPEYIAQPIPRLSRHLDYVSPMVYPSHWGPGQYGVADPIRQPGPIVENSLRDFVQQTKNTGARVVPWLQDFTLYGVPYGPAEVDAQIQGARNAGVEEWFLWDPSVTYTYDGSA